MQFQVPQNIDLEDKIIGPLTLKQFIILLVGGMFDYMFYTFFSTGLFIILAIPTTLFTLALVFAKVQEEPFPKFLASLTLFALKPKILTWGKTPKPKIIENKKAKKKKAIQKVAKGSDIERLSRIIDTQGWNGTAARPTSKPVIPAAPKLAPIPKAKVRPKPFIEKVTKKKEKVEVIKATPPKKQAIQPKISQPQPVKVAFPDRPAIKPEPQQVTPPVTKKVEPAKPIIKTADLNKIAEQVAKSEKASTEKVRKAAEEIAEKLRSTPPEKIKPKDPFWKKIIDKLPKIPEPRMPEKSQPPKKEAGEKAAFPTSWSMGRSCA